MFCANDRRDILLVVEGSKDAQAALHFADAEVEAFVCWRSGCAQCQRQSPRR